MSAVSPHFKITSNRHGVMHGMNLISRAFVEFSGNCYGTVLDIGCAYGVATIPALRSNPYIRVIACDVSQKHLEVLAQDVKSIEDSDEVILTDRLTLINERFPDFELPENSVDAVLISHVLPFLSGKEIEIGIGKIAKFLKPNGVLYVSSYSIYNKVMQKYIIEYEKRKAAGDPWPGEVEDASEYWDNSNPLTAMLPKKLNHLEPCIIEPFLEANRFNIQYMGFLGVEKEIPDEMKHDGRECMGLIASKAI